MIFFQFWVLIHAYNGLSDKTADTEQEQMRP